VAAPRPSTDVTVVAPELDSPDARTLIAALNAELTQLYPEPGATHFRLDAQGLHPEHGVFLIAYRQAQPVGCGALRRIDSTTGELKRIYVIPEARQQHIGQAILNALQSQARSLMHRRHHIHITAGGGTS
jgi:putative acetyltransferase